MPRRRSAPLGSRPLRRSLPAALMFLSAVAVIGCSDGRAETVVRTDSGKPDRAALAAADSFVRSSADADRLGEDGWKLRVEYSEPLQVTRDKVDPSTVWTAPAHCAYHTRILLDGGPSSPGFEGPTSDLDTAAGEGALVTSVAGPGSGRTVLVAVFGHQQVAELSVAGATTSGQDADAAAEPAPAISSDDTTDTAPVDGWTLMRLRLDPPAASADASTVRLRRIGLDGSTRDEELTIDLHSDAFQVPERWRFDTSKVGPECTRRSGTPMNPIVPPTTLLGPLPSTVPTLPPPGAQPADPSKATAEALDALRRVYDLSDRYAASKKDFLEDPAAWMRFRADLNINDVVGRYISDLAPTFRDAVFVSPTEIHVLYRVGSEFHLEIGRVLLIEGRWRVATGTVCRDLSAAGYRCPGIAPDPNPGPLG